MKQPNLFPETQIETGADFSECRKYRYALWRIWDRSKPLVMFIGLNPSTANHETDDPTIESVMRISRHNGYGGFYMMNCWPYISTDPKGLLISPDTDWINNNMLITISCKCQDVVFAWGDFKIVKAKGRDRELREMFPRAKCLMRNASGTPGHPLFKKGTTVLVDFN